VATSFEDGFMTMSTNIDGTKAREVLGWRPTYTFRELVAEMVQADLAQLSRWAKESKVQS
jgi:GDP-D-mannose dehydratase